jgi:hypothetical protein
MRPRYALCAARAIAIAAGRLRPGDHRLWAYARADQPFVARCHPPDSEMFMSLILAVTLLAAQVAASDKLPPANPIPLADADTRAVMAPIDGFLAGIAANDPKAILAFVRPEGGATYAVENADGSHSITRRSWAEVAARFAPGGDRSDERISDPAIESDGDIAMVWAPYVFRVNGTVHHCGVDHFDLIREGGTWKIANASWSSRTTGCDAP